MSSATIYIDGELLTLDADYHPRFINDLKEAIPKGCRSWSPDDKIWEIDIDHLDTVEQLARNYFHVVDVLEAEFVERKPRQHNTGSNKSGVDWKKIAENLQAQITKLTDALVKAKQNQNNNSAEIDRDAWAKVRALMAKEDIKSIYRVLAMHYHPDKIQGGVKEKKESEEKMKKINSLFEELGGK